jgi:hypothetical protein
MTAALGVYQLLQTTQGDSMEKSKLCIALLFALLLSLPAAGLAHDSAVSISGPYDGQVFITDTLPLNITVEGTISHSGPPNGSNVADSRACISVDSGIATCQAAPTFGGRPPSSYTYVIPVTITSAGFHTLQVFTSKTDGGHPGQSDIITIQVVLATATCDEVDPPAYANQYLNDLNLPSYYASYRGQIIKVIAFNHSNGGSCTFNYAAVMADVDALLGGLGL